MALEHLIFDSKVADVLDVILVNEGLSLKDIMVDTRIKSYVKINHILKVLEEHEIIIYDKSYGGIYKFSDTSLANKLKDFIDSLNMYQHNKEISSKWDRTKL